MLRADRIRLQHILDAAREAVVFSQGRSRKHLDTDRMLNLSLVRLLEIIGEAAAGVSSGFQDAHPAIPWPKMVVGLLGGGLLMWLARLSKSVETGRYDPFRKVNPAPPKLLVLPSLPPGGPMPPTPPRTPATPPPRMEVIQLRLVAVMTGSRHLGLVEGIREGRPFKTRVAVGQSLLEEFKVKELNMQHLRLQSQRYRLTLPLGQMKTLQRLVPMFPVGAPPLPPSVVVGERSK